MLDLLQFCTCYLRAWLGHPLAMLRCVSYIRFTDDVIFGTMMGLVDRYRCNVRRHCVIVRRLTPLLRCIGCVVSIAGNRQAPRLNESIVRGVLAAGAEPAVRHCLIVCLQMRLFRYF